MGAISDEAKALAAELIEKLGGEGARIELSSRHFVAEGRERTVLRLARDIAARAPKGKPRKAKPLAGPKPKFSRLYKGNSKKWFERFGSTGATCEHCGVGLSARACVDTEGRVWGADCFSKASGRKLAPGMEETLWPIWVPSPELVERALGLVREASGNSTVAVEFSDWNAGSVFYVIETWDAGGEATRFRVDFDADVEEPKVHRMGGEK